MNTRVLFDQDENLVKRMDKDEILKRFQKNQRALRGIGIRSLAIFGSVARGEARKDSDVDILVMFNKPIGLFEFVRIKTYLEKLLGHPVDLVTPDALRPGMRDSILKEAIYV